MAGISEQSEAGAGPGRIELHDDLTDSDSEPPSAGHRAASPREVAGGSRLKQRMVPVSTAHPAAVSQEVLPSRRVGGVAVKSSWTFHGEVPQDAPSPTSMGKLLDSSLGIHNIRVYDAILASSTDALPALEHLLPEQRPSTAPLAPSPAPLRPAVYAHVFFAVLKSFVGPAILYLPRGFDHGGLLFSILLLPFCGALVTFTMSVLVECHLASAPAVPTYGDLAQSALGTSGRYAVQASLAAAQLGICTSYFIFIARNVAGILLSHGVTPPASALHIMLLVPLVAPLSCVPSLRHLAVTNIVADLLILGGLGTVAAYATARLAHDGPAPLKPWFDHSEALLFVGTACFTFEGCALMVPIAASLERDQAHHFPRVFRHAMVVTVALFTGFGALCYVAIGSGVQIPVTLSVATTGPLDLALKLGYCLAVVFTFPLQMIPIAHMLELAWSAPTARCAPMPPRARRLVARGVLVLATCAFAIVGAKQFDHFVSLIGAACSVPLAFILPCIIYLRLARPLKIHTRAKALLAHVSIAVGLLGAIASGVTAIVEWRQERLAARL